MKLPDQIANGSHKIVLLLSLAVISFAAPAKESDDLVAAEGRSLHAYASAPAPRYGGGASVSSYNRRGPYAQASDLHKPSIYGNSYGAPHAAGPAPYPAPARVGYAPAPAQQRYPAPELSHAAAPRSYGPQRNAFSDQSRQASHDPNYNPAKDPVSQYAQYVPVYEYAPKTSSTGNELSIYGYRK